MCVAGGVTLAVWHGLFDSVRPPRAKDSMRGSYLGPRSQREDIANALDAVGAVYKEVDDDECFDEVAQTLCEEKVVGWFRGHMEFGPRALGGRSIIGDPRSPKIQTTMNMKIKYRESFRPFAPAILAEHVSDWFQLDRPSPYMLIVANVAEHHQLKSSTQDDDLFGIEKLKVARSDIPAVTHVDYSARVQTVTADTNPGFHALLERFYALSGCPILVNTSFNVRGEPIVSSPDDAYRCFMRTEMDYLVIENFVLQKSQQPALAKNDSWQQQFELD